MTGHLPDGENPFIDQRLLLSEMSMIGVPPELEGLLKDQAAKNGVAIARNEPVGRHVRRRNSVMRLPDLWPEQRAARARARA